MEPETGLLDCDGPNDDQATSPGHPSLDDLAERVMSEVSARFRAGDRRGVELELGRYPSLVADPLNAAALIFHELELRRDAGEDVRLEEMQQRFPTYAEALAQYEMAALLVPTAPGPGARFGRFLILEEIGRGGMGIVYRAHDPELHRDVALKVIRTGPVASDDEV